MSTPQTLDLPPGARAHRLVTRRGEFAVLDAGTAERGTVLLLPGFTGSKEDFTGLLRPLAEAGYRAVAVDGRGQHESGGPRDEAAYARSELTQDVLAQAAELGGSPVHLVGHSLGGLIARGAVLGDPAAFASLTLMSSGPGPISAGQQTRLKMLLGALPVLDMAEIWQAMAQPDPVGAAGGVDGHAAAATGAVSDEVQEFLRCRWMANVPEQLLATGRQLIGEPDLVAELSAVPLPKHVLSGAVDDAWPVPLLDEMAERLGARRTVVEGAEHSPNAEQPERTAEALGHFFGSIIPRPR